MLTSRLTAYGMVRRGGSYGAVGDYSPDALPIELRWKFNVGFLLIEYIKRNLAVVLDGSLQISRSDFTAWGGGTSGKCESSGAEDPA